MRFAIYKWLLLTVMHGLAMLPWQWLQTIGWTLGLLLTWVPNRQRRDALINIRLCLPKLPEHEQLLLRRRAMEQFARTFVELPAIWLWPPQLILGLIRQVSGAELLQPQPGRGTIFLTPHLGAWEITALHVGSKASVTCMYRHQRHLDAFILAARQRSGNCLVPDDVGGVKQLLRTLLRGGQVGILPDQVTKAYNGAVFAPFFGIPAVTMLLVAGLARRSGARVVFVFAERLPKGAGFHLHYLAAPPDVAAADNQLAATALNLGVEQCIRHCPEQYQWTYRRFRRRPQQQDVNPYNGPYI